ncbi:hypothetical protein NATSA_07470 [Natronogracilivirgula saccharolytica]|uniref:Uncharacterized protein n=1 Tax=Natronogracilivirga saccharolytica TaxID=2812953 RepID=A0A8J7RLV2_9BACT|nr:hypothetical protein [Natronogracilivirga saccharolytica]
MERNRIFISSFIKIPTKMAQQMNQKINCVHFVIESDKSAEFSGETEKSLIMEAAG